MAEIKTLHLVPREGMQVSEKPSVVRVRFGDGYEQRRPTGLNARLKTFQAVFRVRMNQPGAGWMNFYPGMGVTVPFCGDRRNITGR